MTETDFRIYIDETLYFCAGAFFMPMGDGRLAFCMNPFHPPSDWP